MVEWAHSSNFFRTQRGVRQACPLSPYLFILAAEILAKTVRNNKGITGFSLSNDEVKISQHADDTTLVLDGWEKSLIPAIQSLDDFCQISGLKLNDSTTEALWIGSKTAHEQILVSGKKFKWPKYKVKHLVCGCQPIRTWLWRWITTKKLKTLGSFWVAGNIAGSRC